MERIVVRNTGVANLTPAGEPLLPGEPIFNTSTLRLGLGKGDRQPVWLMTGKEDGSGIAIGINREPQAHLALEVWGFIGVSPVQNLQTSGNNIVSATNKYTGITINPETIWIKVSDDEATTWALSQVQIEEKKTTFYTQTSFKDSIVVSNLVQAQDFKFSGFTKVFTEYKDAVHVFIYDSARDSDGGDWRNKARSQSWYQESLNTSERGDTAKFPALAIIVVQPKKVTILNAENQDIKVWMTFEATNTFKYLGNSGCRRAHMLNGILYVACNNGLRIIDFISDSGWWLYQRTGLSPTAVKFSSTIIERNRQVNNRILDKQYEQILSADIKSVNAFVYQGTAIDEVTGLPRNTVDVTTSKGVNRILANRRNVDIYSDLTVVNRQYSYTATNEQGDLFALNTYANQLEVYRAGNSLTDRTTPDFVYKIDNISMPRIADGAIDANTRLYAYGNRIWIAWCDVSTNLTLIEILEDRSNPENSMIWATLNNYTSGWLAGDYRAAWFINHKTVDRSPYHNNLTEVGTLTELNSINRNTFITGFDANNYVHKGYDADLMDFDDEWTVYLWYNMTAHDASSTPNTLFDYALAAGTGAYMRLYTAEIALDVGTATALRFAMNDGTTTSTHDFDIACDIDAWTFLAIVRRKNLLELYCNGTLRRRTNIANFGTISLGTGDFRIGRRVLSGTPNAAVNASLASFRIAQNSLTADQIATIYRDEAPMMVGQDDRYWLPRAPSPSAPTYVSDMDYDPETNQIAISHERGFWLLNNHVVLLSKVDDELSEYPNVTTKSIAIRDSMIAAATLGGLFVNVQPKLLKQQLIQPRHFKDNRTDNDRLIEFSNGTSDGDWHNIAGIPLLENTNLYLTIIITAQEVDSVNPDATHVIENAVFVRTLFVYRAYAADAVMPLLASGESTVTDERIEVDLTLNALNDVLLIAAKGIDGITLKWKVNITKVENV